MANSLEIKLQEIIEALTGESGVVPPSGTKDQLGWYLDEIINNLNGYLGVFVREFNGLVGIGVSVDASGNPPTASGQEGDHWFSLAFNSVVSDGLPAGWIIIPWMYTDGAWDFSKLLLPIAAKDLHWTAIQNGDDIEGYYIILSGPNETDLPKWELLGATAVVPDKKTIGYNDNGELEVLGTKDPGDGSADGKVTIKNGVLETLGFSVLKKGLSGEISRAEKAEAGILDAVDAAQELAEAAQETADEALPKSDVVSPDDNAATGQAADAAALHTIIEGLVKLVSNTTQEIFSNLALKTYVDSVSGQAKAFQLLGTAIDGTEHTLIELAEYGAAQQIEIGSETIHLNLNNLGPVEGDNHITCDTHDAEGEAVKMSVAWLTDVVSQCAITLANSNAYTDDRIKQLRVDALILQEPCKESKLPPSPFESSHNGYFYQITDFDISYPGENKKGSAVWYDSLDNYYLAVDTYKNADEDTITENSNGEFMVADVEIGTVVADTSGGFSSNVTLGFKTFITAIISKITGLSTLINGLNTAVGTKQNALTAIGTTNLLTAPDAAGGQPGTKALSSFIGKDSAVADLPNGGNYASLHEYIREDDCPSFGYYQVNKTWNWTDTPWGTANYFNLFILSRKPGGIANIIALPSGFSATNNPVTNYDMGMELGCDRPEGIVWSRNLLEDNVVLDSKSNIRKLSATWNGTDYTTLAALIAARIAAAPPNFGKSGSFISGRYFIDHANFTDLPVTPSPSANRWIIDISIYGTDIGNVLLRPLQSNGSAMYTGNFIGTNIIWRKIDITSMDFTSSFVMPDYAKVEDINRITTEDGSWTVDRPGFVQIRLSAINPNSLIPSEISAQVNGLIVLYDATYDAAYGVKQRLEITGVVPVNKGDVVEYSMSGDKAVFVGSSCRYIPSRIVPLT